MKFGLIALLALTIPQSNQTLGLLAPLLGNILNFKLGLLGLNGGGLFGGGSAQNSNVNANTQSISNAQTTTTTTTTLNNRVDSGQNLNNLIRQVRFINPRNIRTTVTTDNSGSNTVIDNDFDFENSQDFDIEQDEDGSQRTTRTTVRRNRRNRRDPFPNVNIFVPGEDTDNNIDIATLINNRRDRSRIPQAFINGIRRQNALISVDGVQVPADVFIQALNDAGVNISEQQVQNLLRSMRGEFRNNPDTTLLRRGRRNRVIPVYNSVPDAQAFINGVKIQPGQLDDIQTGDSLDDEQQGLFQNQGVQEDDYTGE